MVKSSRWSQERAKQLTSKCTAFLHLVALHTKTRGTVYSVWSSRRRSPHDFDVSQQLVLTFSLHTLKDGRTRFCQLVVQDEPLLHQGLPGDVGGHWHHVVPVLQGFIWRQEGCEGHQAYPLRFPPCQPPSTCSSYLNFC